MQELNDPKYCNNMAPNGTGSCCSAQQFEEIKTKWDQCVKRQTDSIYANFYQQIFSNMEKVIARAKEIQPKLVVTAPQVKTIQPTDTQPKATEPKAAQPKPKKDRILSGKDTRDILRELSRKLSRKLKAKSSKKRHLQAPAKKDDKKPATPATPAKKDDKKPATPATPVTPATPAKKDDKKPAADDGKITVTP
jgi:hypothetical protein